MEKLNKQEETIKVDVSSNIKKKKNAKFILVPLATAVLAGGILLAKGNKKVEYEYSFDYEPYYLSELDEFRNIYRSNFNLPINEENDKRLYCLHEWVGLSNINDPHLYEDDLESLFDIEKLKRDALYDMSTELKDMIATYALNELVITGTVSSSDVERCTIETENNDNKNKHYLKIYYRGDNGLAYRVEIKDKKVKTILDSCKDLEKIGVTPSLYDEKFDERKAASGAYYDAMYNIDYYGDKFVDGYIEALNLYSEYVVDKKHVKILK